MSKPVGTYVYSDDDTTKHIKMDVARLHVRTKYSIFLNETYNLGNSYQSGEKFTWAYVNLNEES